MRQPISWITSRSGRRVEWLAIVFQEPSMTSLQRARVNATLSRCQSLSRLPIYSC